MLSVVKHVVDDNFVFLQDSAPGHGAHNTV